MARFYYGRGHSGLLSPRLGRGLVSNSSTHRINDSRPTRHTVEPCVVCPRRLTTRKSFTLVEMLVAMAITLVMMAAVVTLFANVSNNIRRQRSVLELNGQI